MNHPGLSFFAFLILQKDPKSIVSCDPIYSLMIMICHMGAKKYLFCTIKILMHFDKSHISGLDYSGQKTSHHPHCRQLNSALFIGKYTINKKNPSLQPHNVEQLIVNKQKD